MTHFSKFASAGAFAFLVMLNGIAGVPTAAADPGDGVLYTCPPRNGLVVAVTVGDIDCPSAYHYTNLYDQAGDKYQTIEPFTCYSGNGFTAPLLFTCVSEEPEGEFAVYPA